MVSADTKSRLRKLIAEQLGVDEEKILETTSFIKDLNADSLDLAELFMSFEEEFDVEISEEDAQKIETFGDVLSYVGNRHVAQA